VDVRTQARLLDGPETAGGDCRRQHARLARRSDRRWRSIGCELRLQKKKPLPPAMAIR